MKKTILQNLTLALFITVLASAAISLGSEGVPPIADAGSSRYAAQDPVVLDGTGSYDPDNSGPLSYTWRQISGPSFVISDANTATPTISGFVQTDEIQECEFELVLSNGQHESLPDTVELKIVPFFSGVEMLLENDLFDPNKPTIIYFGGGDGVNGLPGYAQSPWDFSVWSPKANLLSFPDGYRADLGTGGLPTYHSLGNALISYLSAMAPNYHQPIQTIGWSTGGLPAIKVATYLNQIYQDTRYAVNRVTGLDAVGPGASEMISQLLDSSVYSEQCWLDSYVSTSKTFYGDILNVSFSGSSHELPRDWYGNSLNVNTATLYNSGIVGGAYWSVIGPGKNLQLAPKSNSKQYIFNWYGSSASGNMDFYDESRYPGRLPEPVTLIGPADGAAVDANGAILTCEESENAVGYQLLFGFDQHRIMDYMVISDTSEPPSKVITTFPFEKTWWTIQVYDAFDSTIYADPVCVYPEKVEAPEPGLIANWKLDETEGDIAYDSAGNNHGTLNGDPHWVSGFIDGALEFDGVDDYVAIGDLDLTGSFTLTCWMRPSSLPVGWHSVVIKEDDYGFEFDGTIFWGGVWGIGTDVWVTTTISTPSIWYHAALTWNGSDVEMFIDASSVGQNTGTHVSNNNPLLFGSWDTSSEFFNGIIDDVRIYNVALTAEEIEVFVQ